VSHEKVQATIDTPSSHQGIERPERKKSDALLLERRAAAEPTAMTESKKPTMIAASTHEIFNMPSLLVRYAAMRVALKPTLMH